MVEDGWGAKTRLSKESSDAATTSSPGRDNDSKFTTVVGDGSAISTQLIYISSGDNITRSSGSCGSFGRWWWRRRWLS